MSEVIVTSYEVIASAYRIESESDTPIRCDTKEEFLIINY